MTHREAGAMASHNGPRGAYRRRRTPNGSAAVNGAKGGSASVWAPPRAIATRREVAMRWAMGEATQEELGQEYGVHRSTVRRWCRELEEWWHCGPA